LIKTTEIENKKQIKTFDLIEIFKKQYSNNKFSLIIGGDLVDTLDKWYKGKKLI